MKKDLLKLNFDLYGRYAVIRDIINKLRVRNEKFKILDIGGQGNLLKDFLPDDEVYFTDIIESKEKNFIKGDSTNLYLEDESFDIVCSADVFEHIKKEKRKKFIDENVRIAKKAIILSAPFYNKNIIEAELNANKFFKMLFNKNHPWLIEHIKNSLPIEEELEKYLSKKNLKFEKLNNNYLPLWALLINFSFLVSRFSDKENIDQLKKFNDFYNKNIYKKDFNNDSYRKIYLIKKNTQPINIRPIYNIEIDNNDLIEIYKEFSILIFKIYNKKIQKIEELKSIKDEKIKSLEKILVDKDNESEILREIIKKVENDLIKRDNIIADKEKTIMDKDNEIINLSTHINNIEKSLTRKALKKFDKIILNILPIGTKRRSLYNNLMIGNQILFNEGLKAFWNRYNSYKKKNSKKSLGIYKKWIEKNENLELGTIYKDIENFKYKPLISIIMPTWNPPLNVLEKAILSIINQYYENWELCIADGNSKENVKKILKKYAEKNKRIKIIYLNENKGISGNSNEAIKISDGEFIGLLDHDDEISKNALYEIVKLLQEYNDADLIYSDEDKIDMNEIRTEPFFKPNWSPDLLMSQNYICHFSVYRKKIIDDIEGFRNGYDGSQDYDLNLRFTEKTNNIYHIPKILYYWRMSYNSTALDPSSKAYASNNGKKALSDALKRRNINGNVLFNKPLGNYIIKREIIGNPLVSIIIPFKDKPKLLENCLNSILRKSSYKNFEIICINNDSKEKNTIELIKEFSLKDKRIKFLDFNHDFNYSKINNFAVKHTKGEHVLLLNNDIEIINNDWIECLLEHSQRPEVGAVGAMLYYSDNTIQHAGIIIGIKGLAGHSHKYFYKHGYGYFSRPFVIQNISAVTGACLMIKKSLYEEIKGLNEKELKIAFNDVDFCLRLREKGYLNIFTPHAELYHMESVSRGLDDTKKKMQRFENEVNYMKKRHEKILKNGDPYYNPNLTLDKEDFDIKI